MRQVCLYVLQKKLAAVGHARKEEEEDAIGSALGRPMSEDQAKAQRHHLVGGRRQHAKLFLFAGIEACQATTEVGVPELALLPPSPTTIMGHTKAFLRAVVPNPAERQRDHDHGTRQ